MAIVSFSNDACEGVGAVELFTAPTLVLVVRLSDVVSDGFEIGFESLADAPQVKAAAKDRAPELAGAIDAAFA